MRDVPEATLFEIYCSAPKIHYFRKSSREALREAVRLSKTALYSGISLMVGVHHIYGPGRTGGWALCWVQDGSILRSTRRA